jgi:hypothetical protein
MTQHHHLTKRILAVAPSTKGFGYAIMEEDGMLVNWGTKSVGKDKNKETLSKVDELISDYQPHVITVEDARAKGSRRNPRIKRLLDKLATGKAAQTREVIRFSRVNLFKAFLAETKGTKHKLAEVLSKYFPQELGCRLPPKRKPWMSENPQLDVFLAVGLALMTNLQMVSKNKNECEKVEAQKT